MFLSFLSDMSIVNQKTEFRLYWILGVVCLTIFSVAYNTTAMMNAAVSLGNELQLTPVSLQWIVVIYGLICASFIIISGQLGDRFSYKNLFLTGALGFMVASAGIALGKDPTTLIVSRAFQGLSAAFLTPMSLAILKVTFSPGTLNQALGKWVGSFLGGAALGPVVSGFLTTYSTWRNIFVINIFLFAIVFVIGFFAIPNDIQEKKSVPLDVWGLILLTTGLVALGCVLVEGNVWGWDSMVTLVCVVVGFSALFVFWFVENHIKHPLIHFVHFQENIFVLGNLVTVAGLVGLSVILYFFSGLVQNPFLLNYSPLKAGLALLPMSVATFVFSLFTAKWVQRFGRKPIIGVGLLFMGVAVVWMSQISREFTYQGVCVPLLLLGAGSGLTSTVGRTLSMRAVPEEVAGEGAGIINTFTYYTSLLTVSGGTLIYFFIGRKTFSRLLPGLTIPPRVVDSAVLGNQAGIVTAVESWPADHQYQVVLAVQAAATRSFTTLMLICLVFFAMVTVFLFILNRNKKVL